MKLFSMVEANEKAVDDAKAIGEVFLFPLAKANGNRPGSIGMNKPDEMNKSIAVGFSQLQTQSQLNWL